MTFKQTEKELIKAIVRYGGEVKSLVDVLNESKLLENRGIAIVPYNNSCLIFLRKEKFGDSEMEEKRGSGYVVEIASLINLLIEKRLIVIIPYRDCPSLVIGKPNSILCKSKLISIDNGKEFISLGYHSANWLDANDEQVAWPVYCSESTFPINKLLTHWFTVSQELKDLVKNNFKSEEDIRFEKQQDLTWISIAAATVIGLLGIIL